MGKISREFITTLEDRLNIEDVVSSYVTLSRAGRNMKGLCPFHSEKTPSFTVFPETRSFYCFGCGAAGDVIGFLMRIENLDYPDAVKFAADKAGLPMPDEGYDDSLTKRRVRLLAANREAAKFFNARLMDEKNSKALNYFLDRGLTPNTIKKFGLGYAPDDWRQLTNHLRSLGFSEQELVLANLAKRSEKNNSCYDNFRNRVMFPIIDVRGNVVAFGGRVLDDSKPKYVNTSDTPVYRKGEGVFALNFAKNSQSRQLILVEGYMDVIALHQAGFGNAIACLGTAFTPEMARLIARYADDVLICYDNDDAGRKATARALDILGRTALNLKVIKMEGGKDADEIIRKFGKERFSDLINRAANDVEYKLINLRAEYDVFSDDGKIRYLTAAAKILAGCDSITAEVYISRLASEFGVNPQAIKAQTDAAGRSLKRREERERKQAELSRITDSFDDKNNPERKSNIKAAVAEETIIASLMKNEDYLKKSSEMPVPDDFVTDFNRRIFAHLIALIAGGYPADLSLFNECFSQQEMNSIYRIKMKGEDIAGTLREFDDCVRTLRAEKGRKQTEQPGEMTDEEWADAFRNIKKKNNKD